MNRGDRLEREKAAEDWIKDFHERFRKRLFRGFHRPEDVQRVRIAILDTGIDAEHPYIQKKWLRPEYDKSNNGIEDRGYRDFVSEEPSRPVDNDGHGTHKAGIILKMAPEASLHVARVADNNTSIQRDELLASRIAKVGVLESLDTTPVSDYIIGNRPRSQYLAGGHYIHVVRLRVFSP